MHTATHAYVSLALVWLVLPVVVSGMGLSPLSSESPQSFAGGRAFVMSEAQKKASERGAVSPGVLSEGGEVSDGGGGHDEEAVRAV